MKIICKYYLLAAMLLTVLTVYGSSIQNTDYMVIPMPREIVPAKGADYFVLTPSVIIIYPEGNMKMKRNAEFLADYIKSATGMNIALSTDISYKGKSVVLSMQLHSDNKEAYWIKIDKNNIMISGSSEAGVFYGIQTLRKSIPVAASSSVKLPSVEINDYPRFGYRGAMLDVCRHFFTLDEVKQFIDMMSLHNLNTFHCHLSDDQGWRIEIKKYPRLREIGSVRKETAIGRSPAKEWDGKPYGGFFTQEEAKEIVGYAAERYINVIPEIDMPGHMRAALAAYPEMGCTRGPYEVWTDWGVTHEVLCAGNDSTIRFIKDVLTEIMDIFPSEYINAGGDECPKIRWKECGKCQSRIEALGLKADNKHTAEDYLQSYFMNEAYNVISANGRKMIAWDDVLEGAVSEDVTVMSWRGTKGGVEGARKGHDIIMAPSSYLYFDYYQTKNTDGEPLSIGGCVPIDRVYSLEPVPAELSPAEAKHIIGVQANLWTEYIHDFKHVQYMELPRMSALSEIQWSDPEHKDFELVKRRLPCMIDIYDNMGYNYARHIFDVEASYSTNLKERSVGVKLSTLEGGKIYYTLDGSDPTEKSIPYSSVLKIKSSKILKALAICKRGGSRILCDTINVNKATTRNIKLLTEPDDKYAYNGGSALIDGLNGNGNYRSGRWIGFHGKDMEAVIDLEKVTSISYAGFSCVLFQRDGVVDARGVEVYTSDNGIDYNIIAAEEYNEMDKGREYGVSKHGIEFPEVHARYVKVKVKSESRLPDWHVFAGTPGFLFIDEIILK